MMTKQPSICEHVRSLGETAAFLLAHGDVAALADFTLTVLVAMAVQTNHLYAQPVVPNQPIKG